MLRHKHAQTHRANVVNGYISTPSLPNLCAHTYTISVSSFTSCRGHKTWFPLPLTFKPSLCAHTHITLLRSCGSTFNAPNYLGPRSSGCCITSGLAGCIFSSDMPLALSPSLSVDSVTTLLLKEPNGHLLKLPSSNHNRSNHCAVPQASGRKDLGH